MNLVGIVAALAAEARVLGPTISTHEAHASLADGSLLAVSGIGCAAATRAARALVDAGATALASWGMAGGLDPALSAGTIFLPAEVISANGTAFATAGYWRDGLSAAVAIERPVARGKLLTSRHAIEDVAGKDSAFRATGALAVDMESLAIAETAADHGLPFIAVRVVVDTAADALPRSVVAASRLGHMQFWRLIAALALAPADLAPLLRLAHRYRAARRALHTVARTGALAALAFPTARNASVP